MSGGSSELTTQLAERLSSTAAAAAAASCGSSSTHLDAAAVLYGCAHIIIRQLAAGSRASQPRLKTGRKPAAWRDAYAAGYVRRVSGDWAARLCQYAPALQCSLLHGLLALQTAAALFRSISC